MKKEIITILKKVGVLPESAKDELVLFLGDHHRFTESVDIKDYIELNDSGGQIYCLTSSGKLANRHLCEYRYLKNEPITHATVLCFDINVDSVICSFCIVAWTGNIMDLI